MQNDKMEAEYHEKIDSFSQFMFGNRNTKKSQEKPSNMGEDAYESENTFNNKNTSPKSEHDPFSWVINGARKQHKEQHNFQNILKNIDYLELIDNIDTLMDSAKKFKPIIQKIQPILKSFLKK